MKYIDAEKLKEVVDRVYNQYVYDYGLPAAGSNMRWIYDAIDSLQQEMWKPSEEQIKALTNLIKGTHPNRVPTELSELLARLKQL